MEVLRSEVQSHLQNKKDAFFHALVSISKEPRNLLPGHWFEPIIPTFLRKCKLGGSAGLCTPLDIIGLTCIGQMCVGQTAKEDILVSGGHFCNANTFCA